MTAFKPGDWVTLKKEPRQIKTLSFGKRYLVHGSYHYDPLRPLRRILLQNDEGIIKSYYSVSFEKVGDGGTITGSVDDD